MILTGNAGENQLQPEMRVIPMSSAAPIDIGNGSWSRLVLTAASVGAQKAMLGYSVFKAGTDTVQKVHSEEELAYVLSGHGQITMGNLLVEYGPGSAIYIPPGTPHGVRNPGPEEVVMVFAFSYPGYPPTTDAPSEG